MIEVLKNIGRFLVILLLQVVLINKIEISDFLWPIVLVYFILRLPFNTPGWILLMSAFFSGLIFDGFINTPGITAFAMVSIAFIRPYLLRIIQGRDGYQISDEPTAGHLGWTWFFKYSITLTFAFHLIFFIALGFAQDFFLVIIWKSILSSIFALIVIFLIQLFFVKNARQ
ncbi:MAG: rod shape-determining protein MreD [Bacteroidales bacterium]|nr:rod shape-determining protein MreD [Bacteroidales bacterium]